MAHIEDRWYRTITGPDGKEKREKTDLHGKGMRYRARYIDPSGRERSKSFPDRAKREAEDFLTTVGSDILQGTYIDPDKGKTKFHAYFTAWHDGLAVDIETRDRIAREFRLHILPYFGDKAMNTIHPATIRSWNRQIQEKRIVGGTRQIADSYRRNLFTDISMMFNAAVDDKVIPRNPCSAKTVKAPKYAPPKVVPWSTTALARCRRAVDERYRVCIDLGSGLGLRQGEIFGFSPDDIDPDRALVYITRQVKIVRSRLVFAPPKGGKEREVPLPDSVRRRLEEHARTFEPCEVTLPWKTPTGPLRTVRLYLYRPGDRALDRNDFNRAVWKRAIRTAGIVDTRENGMHVLRHTYASVLLDAGESIKALSAYLGHADPGFTLRIYTHLLPNSEDRTRRAIDKALEEGEDPRRPDDGLEP